jgi:hypothetical protein
MPRRAPWTAHPDFLVTFSRHCAPTALAALTGVTGLEAAELLAAHDLMGRRRGSVHTVKWNRFLVEEMGLVHVSTERPLEERERLVAERRKAGGWLANENARYVSRRDRYGWYHDVRQRAPNIYQADVRYPTVNQWLQANPSAAGILDVEGHTLAVRNGEVIGDTLRTKSMRRRVQAAFLEG